MKKRGTEVSARVVSIDSVDNIKLKKMFELLASYYDNVTWEVFLRDIKEKNDVILLEHPQEGLCGFSTLMTQETFIEGRKIIGVFSGDTILERKYWGSPALGIQFLSYLWVLKIKNPLTPVYWFLISKGYKTYLLMANNFSSSYPSYLNSTPQFEKTLMSEFYLRKFKDNYNPETGIIKFKQTKTAKLKHHVAPIADTLRNSQPAIKFFETINPGWENGDELACLAKMNLLMPLKYFIKKKLTQKLKQKEPTYKEKISEGMP